MNSLLKWTLLIYFITHIPITLMVDLQVLFHPYYPKTLQDVFIWYGKTYQDHVLTDRGFWFQSFIVAELFLQLPFFFVAVYGLLNEKNWIRIPSIFYGVHVATTVWPIMAETVFAGRNSTKEILILSGFYLPYFFIPLILAVYMGMNPIPFPSKAKKV